MQFDTSLRGARRRFISAGRLDPTVLLPLERVARVLRFGRSSNAEREVRHHPFTPWNVPARVIVPDNPGEHASTSKSDVLGPPPRRKAVVLPSIHWKSFLPPAMQAVAFV